MRHAPSGRGLFLAAKGQPWLTMDNGLSKVKLLRSTKTRCYCNPHFEVHKVHGQLASAPSPRLLDESNNSLKWRNNAEMARVITSLLTSRFGFRNNTQNTVHLNHHLNDMSGLSRLQLIECYRSRYSGY